MKLSIMLSLGALLLLNGCNIELEKKKKKESYTFTENGCTTGTLTFNNHGELCAGLKNDVLNSHCAWSSRKAHYEKHCGSDWALYYNN